VQATLLLSQGNIVFPASSHSSRTYRVSGHVYHVKANLLQEIERMLELVLRLATEANNDIGRQGNCGPQFTHTFDTFAILIKCIAALHTLQYSIIARLYGNIQMLTDLRQMSHTFNHAISHVTRIRSHKTDAFQAIDLAQVRHQIGKIGLFW